MVRKARAMLCHLGHESRVDFGNTLHVAAITRMQNSAGNLITNAVTVFFHLWTLTQHLTRDGKGLVHDWSRAFLFG